MSVVARVVVAWLVVFAALLGASAYAQPEALSGATIAEGYRKSIVHIAVGAKDANGHPTCEVGTGFLITNSGYVITAKHLLEGAKGYRPRETPVIIGSVGDNMYFKPGSDPAKCELYGALRPMELVSTDELQDVALLKIQAEESWDYLKVCKETQILEGEPVVILGFPEMQAPSTADGKLQNKRGPAGMWQTSLSLNNGNSGGPVFNKNGRLIGLVAADLEGANDMSFIVPMAHFKHLFAMADAPLMDCTTADGKQGLRNDCVPTVTYFEVDWRSPENAPQSRVRSSDSKEATFVAQPGTQFVEFEWRPEIVGNADGPVLKLNDDEKTLHVTGKVHTGPFYDQYVGVVKGHVYAKQMPVRCIQQ